MLLQLIVQMQTRQFSEEMWSSIDKHQLATEACLLQQCGQLNGHIGAIRITDYIEGIVGL